MIAPIKPLSVRVAAVIASQGPIKSRARYTRPKIEQPDPATTKRRTVAPALEQPGSVITTVSRSKQARRALVSVMLPGQPPARIDRPAPAIPANGTTSEILGMSPREVFARDHLIEAAMRSGLVTPSIAMVARKVAEDAIARGIITKPRTSDPDATTGQAG